MAGYLGSKAVFLSTTAASVTGNATIGGDLTVGGAFTSQGIDDNASATAMTLDASGNVGIGTSSPSQQLTVSNTSGGSSILIKTANTSGGNLLFGDPESDTSGRVGYSHPTNYMYFNTNGSERMRIDSSGNVGIGTSSPTQSLEVDGAILIKDSSAVGTLYLTNTSVGIKRSNAVDTVNSRDIEVFTDGSGANVVFSANGAGSAEMIVSDSGNVGIGTSSPSSFNQRVNAPHLVVGSGSNSAGVTVYSGAAAQGSINFADGTTTTQQYEGGLVYSHSSNYMSFHTNGGTEAMRITSGGTLRIAGGGNDNVGEINMGNTAQNANRFQVRHQSSAWYLKTVDSEPLVFGTSNTEAMRIDSSGNVGIGTSTPTTTLHVYDAGAGGDGTVNIGGTSSVATGQLFYEISGSTYLRLKNTYRSTSANAYMEFDAGYHKFLTGTGGSEAMRIESDGDVLIGAAGPGPIGPKVYGGNLDTGNDGLAIWPEGDGSSSVKILSGVGSTAGRIHFRFTNPNGTVGQITTSGSATAYATSSDYRLKEDVQPMTGASARVQSLKPCNFAWKADGSRTDGFLAHEAQEVVPEAVTGAKDAVDADGNPEYQGIDQSKLVPLLTAALQEALTKIDALETRITALEG